MRNTLYLSAAVVLSSTLVFAYSQPNTTKLELPGNIVDIAGMTPVVFSSPEECRKQMPYWFQNQIDLIKSNPDGETLLPTTVEDFAENGAVIEFSKHNEQPGWFHQLMITCRGNKLTGMDLTIDPHKN